MRSFYVPTVPDLSDSRRSQFQHRANATSALYQAVKDRGVSRGDVRLGLEQIRYLPFLHEVETWIRSGAQSNLTSTPTPIPFDVRNRAYAKEAFQKLAHDLRIPYYLFDHGIIEPVFVPHTGFAIRVHTEKERWTFLTALSNGRLLAPPCGDSQTLARGLSSSNRQLWNIFELQAPVHLEKALAPRPVVDAGTKRISIFVRNNALLPSSYIYLPPSVNERHLAPKVDWEALVAGQKKFLLLSAHTKKLMATVTIPSLPNSAPLVSWAKDLPPSPFKRFKPLAAYLHGKTSTPPKPIEIEVYRMKKTEAHTQQRILFGKQMTVPAWYPLPSMTIHPSSASHGTRYLGLYPPGVCPSTNPPLRAFTLERSRVHWKPADVDTLWTGLREHASELRALIVNVLNSKPALSRDAWLAIQELTEAKPILTSALLLANQSPFSLHEEKNLKQLEQLPGWEVFRSGLEARLLESQARSVPFVAQLLMKARGFRPFGRLSALSHLVDVSFAEPSNPTVLLTRLAVKAHEALELSINLIRGSHVEAIRGLAGTGPLNEFLRSLGPPSRNSWKESL
jgi:hypothetical protein